MARVAGLDRDDSRIASVDRFRKAGCVLRGIKQNAERRIGDRPALFLADLIVEEPERFAICHDQDRHTLFILKADLAGFFEGQNPAHALAHAVDLFKIGRHRLDGGKMCFDERQPIDRGGGGHGDQCGAKQHRQGADHQVNSPANSPGINVDMGLNVP